MKKSPILSVLCALFLVSSLSIFSITCASAKEKKSKFTETKGEVVSKVETPDMAALSPSTDDGSGWKLVDWGRGKSLKTGSHGTTRLHMTVYLFRDFENFTCRIYKTKNGEAFGNPASLPKESLGAGFHKFHIRGRSSRVGYGRFNVETRKARAGPVIQLECRESDSLPLTLGEL